MGDGAVPIFAFRRNLVLAASAGTGKTYALVGVLVHAALGASELGAAGAAIDPARIAATTFSRKAAAEIRARVVEALERLASGDPRAAYRADLDEARARSELPPWRDGEIAARARDALAKLPRAPIGTLHSFAATLVRTYALERGLSPGVEIADEETTRARIDDAVSRAIDGAFAARRTALTELATAAGGVERLVMQLGGALMRLEEDGRAASSLAIDDGDSRAIAQRLARVVDHARPLVALKRWTCARDLVDAWDAGGEPDRVARALDAFLGVRSGKEPEAASWLDAREALPGASNGDRAARLAAQWALRERFAAMAGFARDLLASCEAELRAEAERSGALGYGDLLRVARDLLRDRPEIAAEVGASLDALLVDEFQDTSRLQRDLVLLAWERDPAARAPGELATLAGVRPTGLLVVGDRKQSIYGFRGADVGVFAEVCVGLAGAPARRALGIDAGRTWEPETPSADFVPLRHNRRGEPELLAMANALSARRFVPGDPPALFEIAYQPHTEDLVPPPGRAAPTDPQLRTTWLVVAPRDDDGKRVLVSSPDDEAAAIAARIARVVREEEPKVHGAPPRWRDVAVLAETNRMLDHVAFALARADIPYVVAGSGFYAAREVRDLVAMLALLIDPGDAWAILEVLRGAWAGVRDETLIALTDPGRGLARVGEAWDEGERRGAIHPDDRAALDEVRAVVLALHRDLDRLGPGRALREAARALDLEAVLARLPRGAQRVANVRKLLAMADDATHARALLERLDDAADREQAEGEAATFADEDDAVRLLTVHASKGLDFPIVILPEVGKPPRAIDHPAFRVIPGEGGAPGTIVARAVDASGRAHEGPSYERALADAGRRERAERQRLAYVASTRASHAMIFVGDREPPKSGATEIYLTTTAAALRAIAEDQDARTRAFLAVDDAALEKETTREVGRSGGVKESHPTSRPPVLPVQSPPTWRSLPIATTALQDFHHCARRFHLAHVLDLPERAPAFVERVARDEPDVSEAVGEAPLLDARAEGTLAHKVLEQVDPSSFGHALLARAEGARVLERAGVPAGHAKHAAILDRVLRFLGGAYAARVAKERAAIAREVPFAIDVRDPEGRAVALRGSIDLLVKWRDGTVDVVDYKRARGPSPEPHAFQLDAYVLAARTIAPEAPRVRAGIVFLGGAERAAEPAWRPSGDPDAIRARLAALGARLVDARWSERFPREPLATCRAIHCGYVAWCHGDEDHDPSTP